MLEDATPFQQINENDISALTPADDVNVPSFSSVKSGLYRHRRNVLPLNPHSRQDVNLEVIWSFMCVDDGEKKNLVFVAGGFRVFNDDTKLHRFFHSGFISFTANINFMILSFVLSTLKQRQQTS